MIYKIVGIILLILSAIFGINHFAGKYSEMNKNLATVQSENARLQKDLKNAQEIHDANIKLLKEEVLASKAATATAIANASEADSKYIKMKDKLNVKTNQYNDLIANGYRLRDNYATATNNSQGNSTSRQGNNAQANSTTTSSSDNTTPDFRLSEGLSRYLITRAGQANAVVEQLIILQDFTKSQHKWILDNCNAYEVNSVVK